MSSSRIAWSLIFYFTYSPKNPSNHHDRFAWQRSKIFKCTLHNEIQLQGRILFLRLNAWAHNLITASRRSWVVKSWNPRRTYSIATVEEARNKNTYECSAFKTGSDSITFCSLTITVHPLGFMTWACLPLHLFPALVAHRDSRIAFRAAAVNSPQSFFSLDRRLCVREHFFAFCRAERRQWVENHPRAATCQFDAQHRLVNCNASQLNLPAHAQCTRT